MDFYIFLSARNMTPYNYIFTLCTKFSIHKDGPTEAEFPSCESLKLTIERTLPYWNEVIVPQLKVGKIKTYMHTQCAIYHDDHQIYFLLLPGRQEYPGGSPRQLSARYREAPRLHDGRGHHGLQPPHRQTCMPCLTMLG